MSDFYFVFKVKPTPKGRPRFSRNGHSYTPLKTRQAEFEIGTLARLEWIGKKLLNRSLEAIVTFKMKFPPTSKLKYPSGDLDNYCKLVFDSLNKIVYEDDKQLVKITASKEWSDENKITLILTELE